jgi:hypothetical protein
MQKEINMLKKHDEKKEEKKRCVPKKGMPHAHKAFQKNRKEREIAHVPKKKRELVHKKEFIHHPPKISTHMHILIKVHDLLLLWIWFLT